MPCAVRPDCRRSPSLWFWWGVLVLLTSSSSVVMKTTTTSTLAFVVVRQPPPTKSCSRCSSMPPAARRRFSEMKSKADNTSGGGDPFENGSDSDSDLDNKQRNGFSPQEYDPSLPLLINNTPSAGKMSPPSKADVYSDDDLLTLLNIHNNLTQAVPGFGTEEQTTKQQQEPSTVGSILSLQDLVERTVQEISNGKQQSALPPPSPTKNDDDDDDDEDRSLLRFESHFTADDFRTVLPRIRGIASDVDGTLLSHDHTLHPLTQRAIERAVEAVLSPRHPLRHFFLATGKTRAGALRSLGPRVAALLQNGGTRPAAGVYIQGAYCVGADGRVLWEQKLSRGAVEEAHQLAQRHANVSLIAYDGDALYASASSNAQHVQDVATKYGEPRPTRLDDIVAYGNGFHKLLIMSDDTDYLTRAVRPELEALAAHLDGCAVTQAVPTMLELLPAGCSKAAGVARLCASLHLDAATQLCAVGDAENDVGMLRQAAVGVAVGNAADPVKEAAAVVVRDTNSEGGAGRAIELFGLGGALELLKK